MTVTCPRCHQRVTIRVQWRTYARDEHGRPVSEVSVPAVLHRCPKEDPK